MTTITKWDQRMLGLAEHIAGWSKDPSTGVGCVITDDRHRILSVGYNGLPAGVRDTPERLADRDTKLMLTQHAERNAIAFSASDMAGATAYVWPLPPCAQCAGALIQAGIRRVVATEPAPGFARWGWDVDLSMEMYQEAGVVVDLLAREVRVSGVPYAVSVEDIIDHEKPHDKHNQVGSTHARVSGVPYAVSVESDCLSESKLRLTNALKKITRIPNNTNGGDWDEIEEARYIASTALKT